MRDFKGIWVAFVFVGFKGGLSNICARFGFKKI